MHPQTCCAYQISLCHTKIEKIFSKIFVMINKDGGNTAVMRGDIEMGGSPTRENPVNSPTQVSEFSQKTNVNFPRVSPYLVWEWLMIHFNFPKTLYPNSHEEIFCINSIRDVGEPKDFVTFPKISKRMRFCT